MGPQIAPGTEHGDGRPFATDTARDSHQREATPDASFTMPAHAWRFLESLDLEAELQRPTRTVREPPRWFRGSLRKAFGFSLKEWRRRPTAATWKLFLLTPRMLLGATEETGEKGKAIFFKRFRQFQRGE